MRKVYEPLDALKSYPIQVKRITTLSYKEKKGVWKIDTNEGPKVLKKFPGTKNRLLFVVSAIKYLQANGTYIPEIVPTLSGNDFAETGTGCFVLSEYVTGRSPSYDSPNDLRDIMQALGHFHNASRGFEAPVKARDRVHLGKWKQIFEKHLKELQRFKKLASRDNTGFSRIFRENVDFCLTQGNQALKMIQSACYKNWIRKVARQKNLCHQDFAASNLVCTKNGIAVLDMDSLTYDLPARDLRKILNKVMRKKGWNQDTILLMLSAYHSVHPLTEDEYKVLYADLLFPNLFYGLSSKYYQKRAKNRSLSTYLDALKMVIQSEKSKEKILSKWSAIINKVMAEKS